MSDDQSAVLLEGLRADLQTIQTWIDGVNATLVRALFPVGSSVLALSADAQRAVLSTAARADEIHVQGGADASGSAVVNLRLAEARAASKRQLLIEGGIGADKVQVIAAQSNYIASNATIAGRALNRRVDIVFANHTGVPVPPADNR